MIIQSANIISGFVLAAPKLKEWGGKEYVEAVSMKLNPFSAIIGGVELLLGLLALFERMGFFYLHVPDFGSSYPQALPAIAIGLILSASYFSGYPSVMKIISELKKYAVWIGIMGIVSGLNSILFGCQLCYLLH